MPRRPPSLSLLFNPLLVRLQPLFAKLPPSFASPDRQAAVLAGALSLLLLLGAALALALVSPPSASSRLLAAQREEWSRESNRQCLAAREWPHPMCTAREMVVWHVPQFQIRKVRAPRTRGGCIRADGTSSGDSHVGAVRTGSPKRSSGRRQAHRFPSRWIPWPARMHGCTDSRVHGPNHGWMPGTIRASARPHSLPS